MRRSAKQDLLLAVCSKMGEVVPLFTDEECEACVTFLKQKYAAATQSVESVASPAFQNLSLRELFSDKAEDQERKEKKSAGKPKVAPSPRAPSGRKARKRALWTEDGDDDEDEEEVVKKSAVKNIKKQVDGKVVKKLEKDSDKWNAEKHGVIVDVVKYDKERDALIVDAKLSAHGKSKIHRVAVSPVSVDKIGKEHWPKIAAYFAKHGVPAPFKETRVAAFRADKK
jgi:hypothetical protein